MHQLLLAVILFSGLSFSYGQTFQWDSPNTSTTPPPQKTMDPLADEIGLASVYADYYEGNPTALGEVFHQKEFTGAHAKLPLGSLVEITRLDNGHTTNVRINDRGAFCDGCIIDLSKAAAQQLGLHSGQQARVKITVTGFRQPVPTAGTNTTPTSYASQPSEPEPQLTAKGVSSPNPHAYTYQETTPPPPTNVAPRTAPAPTARTVAYAATVAPKGPATPISNGALRIIDYLPAPYAVQLGAYNRFANAERHVLRLQEAGFKDVFILKEGEIGHDPLHRVILAPLHSLGEAEDLADQLQDNHQMKAIILQNKLIEINLD